MKRKKIKAKPLTKKGSVLRSVKALSKKILETKKLPDPKMQPLPKPAKRVKANPIGKVIKSNKLSNRTKVTPDQLERIKGMEGEGVASTYNEQGEKEFSLIRKLALAKRKAPKFVLYTDQLGRRLYIGSRIQMGLKPKDSTTAITFDIKQALNFYEGFDNPSDKIKFYNALVPMHHNLNWKSAKLFTKTKIENETFVN